MVHSGVVWSNGIVYHQPPSYKTIVGSVDDAEVESADSGGEAAAEERSRPTTYFTSSEAIRSTLAGAVGEVAEAARRVQEYCRTEAQYHPQAKADERQPPDAACAHPFNHCYTSLTPARRLYGKRRLPTDQSKAVVEFGRERC